MIGRHWVIWWRRASDGTWVKWPGDYLTRKRAMNEADQAFKDRRVIEVQNTRTKEIWRRVRGSWFERKPLVM